ncbi:MAG: ATP-binding protein [Solirubrobacteraceae bacterium]
MSSFRSPALGAPALLSRHLRANVQAALEDTRVVVVLGARQVGKSTLVQQIAASDPRWQVITLDDEARRRGASEDPTGFIADLQTPVVIDEVQRAPDLLLAIKQSVDEDQRPGRYLLTGSANVLTAPTIADALTGRAEYLRLWPFSQAELHGTSPHLIPALFAGVQPQVADAASGRRAHAEMLVAGGFPQARRRVSTRRAAFFDSYLNTVLERDLRTIARVHDRANVRLLLDAIAATTGSALNRDGLSRDLGIAANTVRAYVDLLETLFLIHRLPAWHSNLLSRLVKAPKLHVIDSGLLAYLLGANEERVCVDGWIAGALTETFVVMEVLRQASVDSDPPRFFHFRDHDGHEVDLVLERRDGSVVGIEAKASATAGRDDFRGLRLLRERLGDRFAFGVVMYTGRASVPFGDRLAAIPLQALWAGTGFV